MKTLIKLAIAAALTTTAFAAYAQADYKQDPKWGATVEEREHAVLILNFFNDKYSYKEYDEALVYFRELLQKAPQGSANMYVRAADIYRQKILISASLAQKKAYVDTLMTVYDKRIEAFGDDPEKGKAYILVFKAEDYEQYRPTDRDGIRALYRGAIDAAGDKVELNVVNAYFKVLTDDYVAARVEVDELLNEYEYLVTLYERPDLTEEQLEAKSVFEALFINSGAANCENLRKIYEPRLKADPNDSITLRKAFALLMRGKCNDDFVITVAESYYAKMPSTPVALAIASYFEERKDFGKALKYLNEAASKETDPIQKSNLYVQIAASTLGEGNARAAADYARQAVAANPDNGLAYYIQANAYASGINGCSGFDRQAACWLVYDMLSQARSRMSEGDPQYRTAEQQMGSYRASFPSKEECFFRGLSDGQSYRVNCGWVSGSTTVRER